MREYFVSGGAMKPIERFLAKVKQRGFGCWEWQGCLNSCGYGQFEWENGTSPHRFSYEYFNGPLIDGLTIDHLCRNRCCVNPSHLEQVTERENILRGTGASARNALREFCKCGEMLTYIAKWDERRCATCRRKKQMEWGREYYRKNRKKIMAKVSAYRLKNREAVRKDERDKI